MGVLTRRAAARRRSHGQSEEASKADSTDAAVYVSRRSPPSPATTDDEHSDDAQSHSNGSDADGHERAYESDDDGGGGGGKSAACSAPPGGSGPSSSSSSVANHRAVVRDDDRPRSSADGTAAPNTAQKQTRQPQQQLQQPQLALLALFASGICTSYCAYGIVQERLFSLGGGGGGSSSAGDAVRSVGPITTFLVLSQTLTNCVVAFVWVWIDGNWLRRGRNDGGGSDGKESGSDGKTNRTASASAASSAVGLNHPLLLLNALCYFAAMVCSNEALNHVSYPTVVLAKSSKLIPTMLAGAFLERRSYSTREWAGALLITTGIVVFNWSRLAAAAAAAEQRRREDADETGGGGEGEGKEGDSPIGLALLLFSLAMDGTLASCQGALKRNGRNSTAPSTKANRYTYRPPTAIELMLWTNAYSSLFLLPTSAYTGQLTNGLALLTTPGPTYTSARHYIAVLNGTAAVGQVFIFLTIHCYSSLMCTTITTTRKFVTILLSVRNFEHVFTRVEWSAVSLVFGGLYVEIVAKLGGGGGGGGGRKEKGTDGEEGGVVACEVASKKED